jgi:hypothetical protein
LTEFEVTVGSGSSADGRLSNAVPPRQASRSDSGLLRMTLRPSPRCFFKRPPSLNDKFPLSNDHLPYDDDDSLHPESLYTTFRPTRSPSFITAPSLPHAPSPLLYPLVSIPTHTPLCATASFFFPTFLGFAFALKTFMTALPLSLQRSRNSFANTVLLPPLGLLLALHFLRLLDIHTHTLARSLFSIGTLPTLTTSPCFLYYPTPPLTRCSPPPSLSLNDIPLTVALQPLFAPTPLRTPQNHCCHTLSRPKYFNQIATFPFAREAFLALLNDQQEGRREKVGMVETKRVVTEHVKKKTRF